MGVFKEGALLYAVQIERNKGESVLYVNYLGAGIVPSIAEDSITMAKSVELLSGNPGVSRIVFVQQKNYSYSQEQVFLLAEISRIYNFLVDQEEILSFEKLGLFDNASEIHSDLTYLLSLLRQDPVACYVELKRRIKDLEQQKEKGAGDSSGLMRYIWTLEKFLKLLRESKLIKRLEGDLVSYVLGERDIYRSVFRADVVPNFTFTRLVARLPEDAELVDQYEIGDENGEKIGVTILKKENDSKYIYHVMPPEYSLREDRHKLLQLARNVLTEHRPKAGEFTDPGRTRQVFFNVAKDLLLELSNTQAIKLSNLELNNLARILVRHTVGFGLIEVLLMDKKLQDVFVNAPIPQNRIFVRHEEYDECVTNIIPSQEDADSWAAKLRLISGRPLDEANPVLDTDLVFESARARVSAIKEPLSEKGLAYAFRRHRDQPWTLPLYIKNRMLNSFTAGLLSFMVDGSRTVLVAGTRSAGKTSLLGSLMLEILPKHRIIVIEDTPELPIDSLRKIGFDILGMKVRSALVKGTTEVEASEGIRTSLRLGDSALIVGEVRSDEAKALYEAMRVGALANIVAGTIHGDSPYGVFDRVVNDLGVERTSFKATDLILVVNPIKTSDGLSSMRRVVGLTEVRKHWEKDPLIEKGFVDLLKYNVEKDELEPSDELINGESEIVKGIAGSVKGWAGNWDAVWDNILLRGKIKQEIVDFALKEGKPELMEARFNVLSNVVFHNISDKIRREVGLPISERVFPEWKLWLKREGKKI